MVKLLNLLFLEAVFILLLGTATVYRLGHWFFLYEWTLKRRASRQKFQAVGWRMVGSWARSWHRFYHLYSLHARVQKGRVGWLYVPYTDVICGQLVWTVYHPENPEVGQVGSSQWSTCSIKDFRSSLVPHFSVCCLCSLVRELLSATGLVKFLPLIHALVCFKWRIPTVCRNRD